MLETRITFLSAGVSHTLVTSYLVPPSAPNVMLITCTLMPSEVPTHLPKHIYLYTGLPVLKITWVSERHINEHLRKAVIF